MIDKYLKIWYNLIKKGGKLKLDYTISNPEERLNFVNQLLKVYSPTTNELTLLGDYLLFTRDKNQTKHERKKEFPISTPNREMTISKRQISYEGLIDKLENGEDGLYSLITDTKELKLDNKDPITQDDIDTIPGIADSLKVLESLQHQYENSTGARRKSLKTSIIETWKQIYAIKSSHKIAPPISTNKTIKTLAYISIPEEIYYDKNNIPHSDSNLSLLNPEHVSFLLQYYQLLKEETWGLLDSDMLWHLIDLENAASSALEKKHPLLWDILVWKVDKLTNREIQAKVLSKYGEEHSEQYYSSIWRKRIPKLITEEVQRQYTLHRFRNDSSLYWKKCSKCGQLKPGHSLFYSKNSSKDGFYSQCRECRSRKEK